MTHIGQLQDYRLSLYKQGSFKMSISSDTYINAMK